MAQPIEQLLASAIMQALAKNGINLGGEGSQIASDLAVYMKSDEFHEALEEYKARPEPQPEAPADATAPATTTTEAPAQPVPTQPETDDEGLQKRTTKKK